MGGGGERVMAKIRFAPELIIERLFPGADCALYIVGASFDAADGYPALILDIEGDTVPQAKSAYVEITKQREFLYKFKAS